MYARLGTLVVALVLAAGGTVQAQSRTPADTLTGQQLLTCNAGVPLQVTATGGLWWDAIQGVAPPAHTAWLVVFFEATNLSGQRGSVGSTIAVRDDQGRTVLPEEAGGRLSSLLGTFYDLDGADATFESGTTMHAFALFAMSEDAQALTLVANSGGCS